jgi:hypothetical protein
MADDAAALLDHIDGLAPTSLATAWTVASRCS